MSFAQHIVKHVTSILPSTRAYRLKAQLWRLAGIDADVSARITSSAWFSTSGSISIGERSYIGEEVMIGSGSAPIEIGCDVSIAPRVLLVAGTHEIDMTGPSSAGRSFSKPIKIEDGVWIGANSTVLGGVTIGKKAVVAAGSVVIRDVAPFTLVGGVPARPIKVYHRVDPKQDDEDHGRRG